MRGLFVSPQKIISYNFVNFALELGKNYFNVRGLRWLIDPVNLILISHHIKLKYSLIVLVFICAATQEVPVPVCLSVCPSVCPRFHTAQLKRPESSFF